MSNLTSDFRRSHGYVLAALLCAACAVVAGCGGGGGGGGSAFSAPTITRALAVIPTGFSFRGGDVTIQADVSGLSVRTVSAEIVKTGGSQPNTVPMSSTGGGRYVGTFAAPANSDMGGEAETYTATVTVVDTSGHTTASAPITFEVPAPDISDSPPPPF
jgi:hypothetical protein